MTIDRLNRSLADAAWLKAGPLADLLSVLDRRRRGSASGRRRGAQRADRQHPRTRSTSQPRGPDGGEPRAEAAGFKAVPTGIEHGTVTVVVDGHAVRGHDACARTSKPTAATPRCVRPRLEGRRRAPRLHDQRAVRHARRQRCTIMSAGLPISAPRRVRFIGEPAPRIAEDYLRILRFFRFHAAYRGRIAGPRRAARLHRRARRTSIYCRASACAWR